ncbi:uncharacterized protein [Macrobrachium rosenbergii]|uniref:uncharacterized protein n=1 Tax=Macrobrachium rosenbergii TaxID=79674 RepID=UPI0034D765D5
MDTRKLAKFDDHSATCNSCKNSYDTDSRLPHELECGHEICTYCLETILLSEKKCKDCNREIYFTSASEVPFSLSVLRSARLRELAPPDDTAALGASGLGPHSTMQKSQDSVESKVKKQKATKNMRTVKHGKKHLQNFDMSSRKMNREDLNKRSQTASKAENEKKSVMEDASVGTCTRHAFPVIGYCQTCDKAVCKDCLILEHYEEKGEKICLVTPIVSMIKLFAHDCNDTINLNKFVIEFHKFRIEAFNFYLEEKMSALRPESNEHGTKDSTTRECMYHDLQSMVLDTWENLDELMRALHFYKAEVDNLRCTDQLPCDMREISHSIDSVENHLYPVEIFARKFCKLCPDFSYGVLLTNISVEGRKRLRYVIASLSNSLKLNEFESENIFSEKILVKALGKQPEVIKFSHSAAPEFLCTFSEKQLEIYFKIVVQYNRDLLARLAILPGEEIIRCGRNIWIGESTKDFQEKANVQRSKSSSTFDVPRAQSLETNDLTSQQDNFHLLGARPKIIPGQISKKSGPKAIKSQVPPSSSGSTKNNENFKKPAKSKTNSQTSSTRKENKSPLSSLPKKTNVSFSALTTVLTPSLAFIIATSPVELTDIDENCIKFFQVFSLGKIFESLRDDIEIDINSFNEQKLLHEKRLKCYEQVDLFEDCSNPFAVFINDIFKYSAPKTPPKETYTREEDAALPKSSASQSEKEACQREHDASQRGYDEFQREYEDSKREHEEIQREFVAGQVVNKETQMEFEERQREYEENLRDLEAIRKEWEAIKMKRKSDNISQVNETESISKKETSGPPSKPVYYYMAADPLSAVALPLLSSLAPLHREETNPRQTPGNSDDIGEVFGTGSSYATKRREEELNENLHQNSIKDEQRFETRDKSLERTLDPTDTPDYTFMPNIQAGAEALPMVSCQTTTSRSETAKSDFTKIAETRDNGGSGPQTSITENLGVQKAHTKAKQLSKEHDLDNSYVPYLTSIFSRSNPPTTETAVFIVNYMENFRVPPILSPTGEIDVTESDENETESICCVRPRLPSFHGFKASLSNSNPHDAQKKKKKKKRRSDTIECSVNLI